jgi:hypothetical protein
MSDPLPIMILGLCAEMFFIPGECEFKGRMKSLGRCVSRRELRKRILASAGTIILDQPFFSWSITRMWWSSDDVAALAADKNLSPDEDFPEFDRLECRAFDSWIWDEYLNPVNGRALLAGVWHCQSMAQSLTRDFPALRLIRSGSFGKGLEELGRELADGEKDA